MAPQVQPYATSTEFQRPDPRRDNSAYIPPPTEQNPQMRYDVRHYTFIELFAHKFTFFFLVVACCLSTHESNESDVVGTSTGGATEV